MVKRPEFKTEFYGYSNGYSSFPLFFQAWLINLVLKKWHPRETLTKLHCSIQADRNRELNAM